MSRNGLSWVPKTPSNVYNATQSSSTLKKKKANHQGSSPIHIFNVIDLQAKSISKLAHEMVLLQTENKELRTTNERQSKRRRLKKTHLQDGGSVRLQEAMVLMTDWGLGNQDYGEMSGHDGCTNMGEPHVRLCSNSKKPGHNIRTCQLVGETSEERDSK